MKHYRFETAAILAILVAVLLATFRDTVFASVLCGLSFLSVVVVFLYMFFSFFHTATTYIRNDYMDIGRVVEPVYEKNALIVYRRMSTFINSKGELMIMGAAGGDWRKMQLVSHEEPTMNNSSGIYGYHDMNDKHLDAYKNGGTVLAKVELRGKRVVHDIGSRGHVGRVLEIISAEENAILPEDIGEFVKVRGKWKKQKR